MLCVTCASLKEHWRVQHICLAAEFKYQLAFSRMADYTFKAAQQFQWQPSDDCNSAILKTKSHTSADKSNEEPLGHHEGRHSQTETQPLDGGSALKLMLTSSELCITAGCNYETQYTILLGSQCRPSTWAYNYSLTDKEPTEPSPAYLINTTYVCIWCAELQTCGLISVSQFTISKCKKTKRCELAG